MPITKIDERFDEITLREIRSKIAEAFLDLETNIRMKVIDREFHNHPFGEKLIKEKANQMKTEINDFIDSQVNRIIGQSKIQSGNETQVLVRLEEIKNQ